MCTLRPRTLSVKGTDTDPRRSPRRTTGGWPKAAVIGLLSLGVLFVGPLSTALSVPDNTASRLSGQQAQQEDLTIDLIMSLTRMGVSDEALTAVIRDSGTQFVLDAEDILWLRERGLSERVIRAMLGATPSGGQEPSPRPSATAGREPGTQPMKPTGAQPPPPAGISPSGDGVPFTVRPSIGFEAAANLPVDVRALHEESSPEHEHSVVVHGGVGLLFIRAEGGYPTTRSRAEEAARAYEVALRTPGASVELRWMGGEPALWVRADTSDHLLLRVGRGDVAGYARHSSGSVESALLATWWWAVLSDYVAVIRDGSAPRLVVDHDLAALADAIRARSGPGTPVSVETLGAALLTLEPEVRERLEELGHAVPQDFSLRILPGVAAKR